MPFILLSAVTLAVAVGAPVHQTTVQHAGASVTAVYHVASTSSTRQMGAHVPNRQPIAQSCAWTADLTVNRAVSDASGRSVDALAKPVHRQTLTGIAPGSCATAAAHVNAAVAKAHAAEAQLAAEQDRDALHRELNSLSALSARQG